MVDDSERWLTPKQVADQLQVTHKTVLEWIGTGKIKAKKLGRVWRVTPEAFKKFTDGLESNQDQV